MTCLNSLLLHVTHGILYMYMYAVTCKKQRIIYAVPFCKEGFHYFPCWGYKERNFAMISNLLLSAALMSYLSL